MKTGIKILDAMTKSPIVISPNTDVVECAKIMIKEGVGGIIVKENHSLVGMVTEKDLVDKLVSKGLDPKKVKVKDVMTKSMITIEADKDIYDALVKMRDHDVRRLPVVHENKLIGLLTEKDILMIQPELFDILVERFRLREESEKPIERKYTEGECESCGNYARLYDVDGQLLCEECKEEEIE